MGQGGSAQRYENVNPYTDATMSSLNTAFGNFQGASQTGLDRFYSSLGAVPTNIAAQNVISPNAFDLSQLGAATQAFNAAGSMYDPMQAFNQLGDVSTFLQGLSGPGSGYIENALQQAQRASEQGLQQAAVAGRQSGNLYSGATAAAMSEAAIDPLLAARQNIFNTANQNYQALLGQGLGLLGQGNIAQAQFGLQGAQGLSGLAGLGLQAQTEQARLGQAAQLANQQAALQAGMANQQTGLAGAGMLGNLYGTQIGGMTNVLGTLGGLSQPETIYQPTWWERVGSGLLSGSLDMLPSLISAIHGGGGGTPYGNAMSTPIMSIPQNWGNYTVRNQPGYTEYSF